MNYRPVLLALFLGGCTDLTLPNSEQSTSALTQGPVTLGLSANVSVIDLGALPARNTSIGRAINSAGDVVGLSYDINGASRPILWANGTLTDVGTPFGSNAADLNGINDIGTIIGNSSNLAFGTGSGAFWVNGTWAGFYYPLPGDNSSSVKDINNLGDVVGYSMNTNQAPAVQHAVLWPNGAPGNPIDIGSLGGALTIANAVDDQGRIVGVADSPTGRHAFLWQNGVMTDLGTLPGGSTSEATGINASGQVVGYSFYGTPTVTHAVLWQQGTITDLHTLPGGANSMAYGINDLGQIVGYSEVAGVYHAVLWQGVLRTDLSVATGLDVSQAVSINNSGQVAGWSCFSAQGCSQPHAMLWTVSALPPPAPNAGGPYTANEGAALTLNGAGSSDPNGGVLTYDWDFGDGTAHGTGVTPVHAYADNGSYSIGLTANGPGGNATATTTATITNVAPTATFSHTPTSVKEGVPFTLALTGATDPSSADVAAGFTYAFNCGSGYGPFVPSSSRSCSTVTFGSRTVSGQVRDKDGGTRTYSATQGVTNRPPVASIVANGPTTISAGGIFKLNATFVDPGTADNPWTVTIAWGNGTTTTTSSTQWTAVLRQRQYANPGTYAVKMTVKDRGSLVGTSNVLSVVVQ